MCHKNIVEKKNYGFNFSLLGHGAYLLSANGGVWSDTSVDCNNKIKVLIRLCRDSNLRKVTLSQFQ